MGLHVVLKKGTQIKRKGGSLIVTRLFMKGALVCCACVVAGTARADSAAISVTGPINPPGGAQPFNYTQGSYIAGFAFKVKTPISITQLGFYDSNLAGVAETFNSAPVGVYDLSTNTLLVSARDRIRKFSDPLCCPWLTAEDEHSETLFLGTCAR